MTWPTQNYKLMVCPKLKQVQSLKLFIAFLNALFLFGSAKDEISKI